MKVFKQTSTWLLISLAVHLLALVFFTHGFKNEIMESFTFSVIENSKTPLTNPNKAQKPEVRPSNASVKAAAINEEDQNLKPQKDLVTENESPQGAPNSAQQSPNEGIQRLDLKILYPKMALRSREEGRAEYLLEFSGTLELLRFKRLRSTGFARLDQAVDLTLSSNLKALPQEPVRRETLIIDFRLMDSGSQVLFSSK